MWWVQVVAISVFFFNDTATTEIYTLSLHDALPICGGVLREPADELDRGAVLGGVVGGGDVRVQGGGQRPGLRPVDEDRKSTRLNSSHANISYVVFCLTKKTYTIVYLCYSVVRGTQE